MAPGSREVYIGGVRGQADESEKIELSLEQRQVAILAAFALVLLGVVFALGVMVGRQLASASLAAPVQPPAGDLRALDAEKPPAKVVPVVAAKDPGSAATPLDPAKEADDDDDADADAKEAPVAVPAATAHAGDHPAEPEPARTGKSTAPAHPAPAASGAHLAANTSVKNAPDSTGAAKHMAEANGTPAHGAAAQEAPAHDAIAHAAPAHDAAAANSDTPTAPPSAEELKDDEEAEPSTEGKSAAAVAPNAAAPGKSAPAKDADALAQPEHLGKFTVQFGATKSKADAEKIAAQARAQGIKQPYVVTAHLDAKGTWYRVRAGAFESRDAASELQKSVDARLHVKSAVMSTN